MSFPEIAVLAILAAMIVAFGASLKWLALPTARFWKALRTTRR
jgi:hypothetical protein